MRKFSSRDFPAPNASWDPSTKEVWNQLTKLLEDSSLFDRGRRTRPAFIVKGTVSAVTTLDMNAPNVSTLTHVVGKLLIALQGSIYLDVRTDL